jgi:hypothetical protein
MEVLIFMKDQLLNALRAKIEYPNEYTNTELDEIWIKFRYTDEYKIFMKSDFKELFDYLFSFLTNLAPNYSTRNKIEVVLNIMKIMLSGPFSLPNIYIKLLNTYKSDWLPLNRNKFELVITSLEKRLNEAIPNNYNIEEEQLGNIGIEGLEIGLGLSNPQKDESLSEKQTKIKVEESNDERTEQLTSENSYKHITENESHKANSQSNEEHSEENKKENEQQEEDPPRDMDKVFEEIMIKWNHIEIEDGPDKYEESFHKWDKNAYDPITLIGARVRGKKHKHEGTNCDDWFAMESPGKWNIIAVSDGAGSKRFSRVGARVSSEAAVEYLKEQLGNFNLEIKGEGNDFARDPETYQFVNKDLAFIEESLHTAFFKAYHAMELAVKERMEGEEASVYQEILHRDLEVNDLSCTLLLAVQTMLNGKSFILACQIGDGATVAITENPNHPVFVLGTSDGGQYSGETDFLTSRKFEKKNYLLSRTYPCYGTIKALLVMTDGVADDYFPSNERMNLLYEDLCREKIIVKVEEEDYAAQAERLENWIDSYQVRGSFDDRTLVIAYKGDQNE